MAPFRRKKLFLSPTFTFPMISVALLFGAFSIYYLLITSRQEASVTNRAFRSLAAISDQIQSRIINYVPVIEQAAKKQNDTEARKYLETYVRDLRLRVPDAADASCVPGTVAVGTRFDQGRYFLEFCRGGDPKQAGKRPFNWRAEIAVDELVTPLLQDSTYEMFDDILLTDDKGTVLYQTLKTGNRISDLAPLVKGVTPDQGGKTEAKSTASPETSLSFSTVFEASSLLSVPLAGTEYKLYLVPVSLKVGSPSKKGEPTSSASESSTLVVCGLMQASRFRAKSLAVPETALVTLVLLLPVVIVGAWPLLKLAFMQTTERISRRAGLYFISSTLITIMLICMLAIHLRHSIDTRDIDGNLTYLARAIEDNLKLELQQTLEVMDSIGRSTKFKEVEKKIRTASQAGKGCKEQDQKLNESDQVKYPERDLLTKKGLQLNYYPYFNNISWTDNRGNQRIKWEVAEQTTPPTSVGDRLYFKATLDNQLWSFSSPDPANSRFRVDPVFSRYTGEYVAVISKPAPPIKLCSDTVLSVVSMGTSLLSLTNPVLPPDYGFAVIDKDGKVLFHSTPARNDRENFSNELKDSAELQAAVIAGRKHHLNAQYLGFDHRLFVTPLTKIRQSPWTLVVFYDLSTDASRRLGEMTLFAVLVLIYYCFILICLFLAYLFSVRYNNYPPQWIWPCEQARGRYLHITLTLALLILAFYLLIFEVSLRKIVIAAFSVPLVGATVLVLKLRSREGVIRWMAVTVLLFAVFVAGGKGWDARSWLPAVLIAWMGIAILILSFASVTRWLSQLRWPSFQTGFIAVGVLTAMLAGVLPSIAFFKIAYDYHVELWTRREQIQTLAALAVREERVKKSFSRFRLSSEGSGADGIDVNKDLGKWLFLRRRLEQSLDRYDIEFLKRLGQIYSNQPAVGRVRAQPDLSSPPLEDPLPYELTFLASRIPYGGDALTRQLSQATPENSVWAWNRDGTNRLHLQRTLSKSQENNESERAIERSPPAKALRKSTTNDPIFLSQDLVSALPILKRWPWAWALPVILCSGVVMFFWIGPTIRRLFLLRTRSSEPYPTMTLDTHSAIQDNLIVLQLGHRAETDILRERKDVFLIDVAATIRGEAIEYESISGDQRVVALDRFHFRNEDIAANRQKLEILETLARKYPQKRVLIITTIDPILFVEGDVLSQASKESVNTGEDIERWAHALFGFKRVRLDWDPAIRSSEWYRIVWSTCTLAQRAALYQLAYDGWANYKNDAALNQLQMRGFIKGKPFRIVDDGFREFILRTVSSDDRRVWEALDNVSIWKALPITFLVLGLGVIAVVLFYNQQALLGYIVTLVSVLAPAIRLFTEGRGPALGLKTESNNE